MDDMREVDVDKGKNDCCQDTYTAPCNKPFPITFAYIGDKRHGPHQVLRAQYFAGNHYDQEGKQAGHEDIYFAAPLEPEGIEQSCH